jgi:hypothetical protein
VANGMRLSTVVWVVLGAVAFYGTLHWRESDNAAVAQAQARVQALQAQWRDVQQAANPVLAQGSDPAHQQQRLLAESSAAGQAKLVRDDMLSLLALSRSGLNWQGMQLDRQGVWQLQLRGENQSTLDLWRQQIGSAGLSDMQWVHMTRSAPNAPGKDAALALQEPQSWLLTLRAPLGSLSIPPTLAGDPL